MADQATDLAFLRSHKRRAPAARELLLGGLGAGIFALFLLRALNYGLVGNLQVLAISMATIGIVAAGQTVVVLTGGVDLSVGSLVALTSVVAAKLATIGFLPPYLAAAIALAIATAIGWLHGWLISRFRLAPFIVTFGSLSFLLGAAKVLSNQASVNIHTDAFDPLWANLFGVVPVPILIMLGVFAALAFVLHNARLGRYIYAVGSNEHAARLSGVNVAYVRQMAYAISGFLAGLSGLLIMAHIKGGIFSNGQGYELLSIAAVIIGGTSLAGGSGGVWGTLVGILVIRTVQSGLSLFNIPWQLNDMVVGAFIVAAALIDRERRRMQESAPASAPTPPPAPLPVIGPIHSLDQAVRQLQESIRKHCAGAQVMVYLLDHEAGSLFCAHDRANENHQAKDGGPILAPFVQAAWNSGKPQHVRRAANSDKYDPSLWSEMRAGAALPLLHLERTVGVVEVQSKSPDVCSERILREINGVTARFAVWLDDYARLETGWIARQARDALRNLSAESALEQSALADWLLPATQLYGRGAALHQKLYDAIEHLKPDDDSGRSRAARRYEILKQTYLQQKNADAIILELGLSRRQYFYDLKEAIDAVAHYLVSNKVRM